MADEVEAMKIERTRRMGMDPHDLIAELDEEIERLKAEQGYDRQAALEATIKSLKSALYTHACPDDGSIDTRCYPHNATCPARILSIP